MGAGQHPALFMLVVVCSKQTPVKLHRHREKQPSLKEHQLCKRRGQVDGGKDCVFSAQGQLSEALKGHAVFSSLKVSGQKATATAPGEVPDPAQHPAVPGPEQASPPRPHRLQGGDAGAEALQEAVSL